MMKKQGFTVVELIVVVAIISLLCAAGMFSASIMFGQRLDAEARKLLSDLCWAREMAVSKHRDHFVDFDIDGDGIVNDNGIYNIYEDFDEDGLLDTTIDKKIKGQDLKVDITTTCPNILTFQTLLGEITLNPVGSDEIRLEHEGKTRRLMIYEETGYVSLE